MTAAFDTMYSHYTEFMVKPIRPIIKDQAQIIKKLNQGGLKNK